MQKEMARKSKRRKDVELRSIKNLIIRNTIVEEINGRKKVINTTIMLS